MELPPELKLNVLRHLGRQDHKALRLVSKDWSVNTSGFLFNRLYWSPQDLDIEVFKSIVTRPELAQCVKEFIFDGSQFVEGLTKRDYFQALCLQHEQMYLRAERAVSTFLAQSV